MSFQIIEGVTLHVDWDEDEMEDGVSESEHTRITVNDDTFYLTQFAGLCGCVIISGIHRVNVGDNFEKLIESCRMLGYTIVMLSDIDNSIISFLKEKGCKVVSEFNNQRTWNDVSVLCYYL